MNLDEVGTGDKNYGVGRGESFGHNEKVSANEFSFKDSVAAKHSYFLFWVSFYSSKKENKMGEANEKRSRGGAMEN